MTKYFTINGIKEKISIENKKKDLIISSLDIIEKHLELGKSNGRKGKLNDISKKVLHNLCLSTDLDSDDIICLFDDRIIPECIEEFNISDFLYDILSFDYVLSGTFHKYGQAFNIDIIKKVISIIEKYSENQKHVKLAKEILGNLSLDLPIIQLPTDKIYWLIIGDYIIGKYPDSVIKKQNSEKLGIDIGNEGFNQIEFDLDILKGIGEDLLWKIVQKSQKEFLNSEPILESYMYSGFKQLKDFDGFNHMFGIEKRRDISNDILNQLHNLEEYILDYCGYLSINGISLENNIKLSETSLKGLFVEVYNKLALQFGQPTINKSNSVFN